MDWFWSLFDGIIQNRIWNMLFGNFRIVDWITITFALIGLIYGLKHGFFRCLAVTIETIVLLWIVMTFYKKIGMIIFQNLNFIGEGNARPVGYALLLFGGGALMVLLDGKLKNIFHTKLTGPLRIPGGAVFGVFFLLLLWSLLSNFFLLLPYSNLHKPYGDGGSRTGPFIGRMTPTIYKALTKPGEILEKSKV